MRNDRQVTIETVGVSDLRYRGLLGSPDAGATSISYPTAVGAAILAWHALEYLREEVGELAGVVTGEDLARLLPRSRLTPFDGIWWPGLSTCSRVCAMPRRSEAFHGLRIDGAAWWTGLV